MNYPEILLLAIIRIFIFDEKLKINFNLIY